MPTRPAPSKLPAALRRAVREWRAFQATGTEQRGDPMTVRPAVDLLATSSEVELSPIAGALEAMGEIYAHPLFAHATPRRPDTLMALAPRDAAMRAELTGMALAHLERGTTVMDQKEWVSVLWNLLAVMDHGEANANAGVTEGEVQALARALVRHGWSGDLGRTRGTSSRMLAGSRLALGCPVVREAVIRALESNDRDGALGDLAALLPMTPDATKGLRDILESRLMRGRLPVVRDAWEICQARGWQIFDHADLLSLSTSSRADVRLWAIQLAATLGVPTALTVEDASPHPSVPAPRGAGHQADTDRRPLHV